MKYSITSIPKKLQFYGFISISISLLHLFQLLSFSAQRARYIYFLKYIKKLKSAPIEKGNPSDYTVYVINREKDKKRLKSFRDRACKLNVKFELVQAIDCLVEGFDFSPYLHLIGESFYGDSNFPKGSIGSFLSHRKSWLRFLETNNKIAFICEDDALLLAKLPIFEAAFKIPEDADIIFANSRMGEAFYDKESFEISGKDLFSYYILYDTLLRICRKNVYIGGPGLDAYIITRSGAKKLLDLYDELKYGMNNDWFVVFNSLSAAERNEFRKLEGTGRLDRVNLSEGSRLRSYVMVPSLVELADFDTSIRMLDEKTFLTKKQMCL